MKLCKTISGNISRETFHSEIFEFCSIKRCKDKDLSEIVQESLMARHYSLLKALLNFVRLDWTSDWLTRSVLLGFSDLLATRRSFYCNVTSHSRACHFSGVIHRNNVLTAKIIIIKKLTQPVHHYLHFYLAGGALSMAVL